MTDEGFDYSVLSAFRTRLVQGSLEQLLLDTVLKRCQARGWLKARGRQRTDSSSILGAVKALNQLELVGETLRCGMRSMCWPPSPPNGSSRRSNRSGLRATLSVSRTIAYPKTRPNATP